MENYLYFRTQPVLANDDDESSSVVFPVSSFLGMHPTSDNNLTLFFKPRKLVDSTAMHAINPHQGQTVAASTLQKLSSQTKTDNVTLAITENKHKEVMQALANTMTQSQAGFINVADDVSSAPSYLHPNITSCGAIVTQSGATVANSVLAQLGS